MRNAETAEHGAAGGLAKMGMMFATLSSSSAAYGVESLGFRV